MSESVAIGIVCLTILVGYGFIGVVTFEVVHPTVGKYANAKALILAIVWPISWVVILCGFFLLWVMDK